MANLSTHTSSSARQTSYSDDPQLALRQVRKLDLFDSDSFPSAHVKCSENRAEGTFPETVSELLAPCQTRSD